MNNQNPNPNNGVNGGNGAAPENGGQQEKVKMTIGTRIMKARDRVLASKAGRITVKVLKIAGLGGLAYASFEAGKKSVKPTTIYIKEGVTEDENPVEDPEPETEEEE